ncbi:hypothetical protein SLS64_000462 [Diaporthe eres]|uniref:Uncharacterized protein n=1 Tax=Diaporthe eres TaxID=83184 RepID=A0ABR1PMD1_DIAER
MVHHASLVLACLLGSAAASFVPSDTNLDERSSAQVSTDGTLYCGNFGSADKDTVSGLERDLSTGNLKDKWYHIKAGECNRVHCDDTSGIYVCNDGDLEIPLSGSMIGKGVRCISEKCCRDDVYGLGQQNTGQSGQKFFQGLGVNFNIAIAYGNCGDPVNIRPDRAGGWDGNPNPKCKGGVLVPNIAKCY